MKSTSPPSADRPRGLILQLISGVVTVTAGVLAALVLSVLIEWGCMTFLWSEEGSARSAAVLRQDVAWLTSRALIPDDGMPVLLGADLALHLSRTMVHGLFVSSGLDHWFALGAGASAMIAEYLSAASNAIRTTLVRLAILISALPLFVLFVWWGAMEGLVRRDLRRWGGDIERGTVYHLLKHLAGAVVALPVILYLAWPDSIHPGWIFIPCALFLGILVMAITSTFTKYV